MTTGTMAAPVSWPRFERAGWFWIFVAVSVAAHAVFFLRSTMERATVEVAAAPREVMSVRLVEVRPAPREPVVAPEPLVVPPTTAPEPVITRQPEPAVLPPPPKPAVAPAALPKPVPPKVAAAAPAKPDTPSFVEARPSVASNRPPHYPDLARRNGWQGLCLVRVAVECRRSRGRGVRGPQLRLRHPRSGGAHGGEALEVHAADGARGAG